MAIAIALPVENPGAEVQMVPSDVNTLPDVPGETTLKDEVALPRSTALAVWDVVPDPPLPTPKIPLASMSLARLPRLREKVIFFLNYLTVLVIYLFL